jgi:outer membrane lipopolysaccharide assembly protein LptE/RlpB
MRLLPLLLALVCLLPACSHYRVGTGAALKFSTLYVAPVANEATLPQARALIGARLREAFLRDSRVTLVATPEEADAVLTVTLKKYSRDAAVARADDAGLARKFALTLTATCDLRTRDGGNLFSARPVSSQRDAYVDGGQLQSEYETLGKLADSLAVSVTHAVLDTW